MKVTSKVNNRFLRQFKEESRVNLIKTADAIRTDLIQSQTMPFKTGNLQNLSTFIDDSKSSAGKVRIVSDTPYARRLYFHPEYNFSKANNPNAGGMWFEPYKNGNKKDFAKNTFAKLMKRSIR